MSTLKATNLQHESSASPNIVLTAGGNVTGTGMDLIVPTSVVGSGVTLSGGKISFTAASSVSINGCFTSAYDSYRVEIYSTITSSIFASFRFRSSNLDNETNNYYGASSFDSVFGEANNWPIASGSNANLIAYTTLNFYAPALPQPSGFTAIANMNDKVTLHVVRFRLQTVFDGFTIFAPIGTLSGTIRVYGLRNA